MQSIFGTDGIRGIFNKDITYSLVKNVGYGYGITLKNNKPVLIGRDTRESGKILLEALTKGLNSAQKEVIDIGVCPTPAIPFLIKNQNLGSGIMISASHNPPEYNGIKIFDEKGEKLKKTTENQVEKNIKEINENLFLLNNNVINFKQEELLHLYEGSLIKSIGNQDLTGMKIILDTCNGSATSCAEKVFKKLGADIYSINNKVNGKMINVNCGSTFLSPLKKAVKEIGADLGFSFDGDADRVIGVDSSGNVLDGDHILFLWGRELLLKKNLSNNILITTIMGNLGFEKAWNKIGGKFIRTPVGDKFIYEEILKHNAYLGGEQSGHILSKINNFNGDGILTAIQISKYCKDKNIKLIDFLKTSFKPYPQKLTNIKLNTQKTYSPRILEHNINEAIEKKLSTINEPCRIFARHSGTEPLLRILVEARNKKLVESSSLEIQKEIQNLLEDFNINV